MPRYTSRSRSEAEMGLHEALTVMGFLISYFALMTVAVSATMPFLSTNWSAVWPIVLSAALLASLLIGGALFVWPTGYRHHF
jgi:hypothetical protein